MINAINNRTHPFQMPYISSCAGPVFYDLEFSTPHVGR
uniref:Uncharacterized protein n=1 Tax=Arundo donax TaxID=35708 RepID=A0A0A9A9E6_ARUDO